MAMPRGARQGKARVQRKSMPATLMMAMLGERLEARAATQGVAPNEALRRTQSRRVADTHHGRPTTTAHDHGRPMGDAGRSANGWAPDGNTALDPHNLQTTPH
eukprot:6637341-Pyramimonas_sp.AAC.1